MLALFRRSPKGLRATHRALDELAKAIRHLDKQRDTRRILTRLGPMLGDTKRELNAYESLVTKGEDLRTAAWGFRFRLGLLSTEIKKIERKLIVASGLIRPRRSPLELLCGPLENLKTVGRQLNGPETEFQRELNELIRKSGITPYALAASYGQDPSYLYKLMKGERRKPSRESVTEIAKALMECSATITAKDADRLLLSAGYPPLTR